MSSRLPNPYDAPQALEMPYGVIGHESAYNVPRESGVLVPSTGLFRPVEPEIPERGLARVWGLDEYNQLTTISLEELPGVEPVDNLSGVLPDGHYVSIRHSKVGKPEGHRRILAVIGADQVTEDLPPMRFGWGELPGVPPSGHRGEGKAIYVQALQVGRSMLGGGAVQYDPVGLRNFPFYAFRPDMTANQAD